MDILFWQFQLWFCWAFWGLSMCSARNFQCRGSFEWILLQIYWELEVKKIKYRYWDFKLQSRSSMGKDLHFLMTISSSRMSPKKIVSCIFEWVKIGSTICHDSLWSLRVCRILIAQFLWIKYWIISKSLKKFAMIKLLIALISIYILKILE